MSTSVRDAASDRPVRPLALADADLGVLARVRQVVAAQPDAVAATNPQMSLTYAQLAAEAARVCVAVRSAVLRQPPPHPEASPEPIALLHTHDPLAVAALMGILASRHPVMVLDPRTPAARLSRFVERGGTRFCVADEAHRALAAEVVPHVVLGADAPATVATDVLWAVPLPASAAAALTFTSGSTGQPKGVVNDHATLVRDAWVNSLDAGCYDAGDIVAHTLPMAFHAGLMVTVAGVVVGARMDMYDVRTAGIGRLAERIDEVGATVMHASPAILRAFVGSAPDPALLSGLHALTIAGEAAHGRDVEAARTLLPSGCVVRNRYGSSETGLIADYAVASDHPPLQGPLPVGRPVGDSVLVLIDENGVPVPDGEPGTITVTARHMARGYWQDPELTAGVFRDNPDGTRTYRTSDIGRLDESGQLRLLGRRDHSVKVRGYLVEPAEVDAAIFALPDVREAVVVGLPRPGDELMRLVAYVVSDGERPSAVAIRAALHDTLPGYMVPETVVFLPSLPRTERGKLDRSALPQPPAVVAGTPTADLTEWERVVEGVWATVLALPWVGKDDDFFQLGGDSLAAQRLMSLMVSECGVPEEEATTTVLVQAPTLSAFCRRLQRRNDSTDQTLVPLRTEGSLPPLFFVAGGGGLGVAAVTLIRHLDPDQPAYALQAHGMERRGIPDWSVRARARRHVRSLRSVQPAGPYYLSGHSFGGLVALEMAQQLQAAGEEVALLAILDSFPPDPDLHPGYPPRPLVQKIKETIGVALTGVQGTPGEKQYWRFHLQSTLLGMRYRSSPYAGRTLVVVAQGPESDIRRAWEPHLTGDWELVELASGHLNMLRDPYVAETAAALGDALRAARTGLPCLIDLRVPPNASELPVYATGRDDGDRLG